jgi:hypothetical protein
MKLINYSSTSEFNKNLKKLHCCSQDCLSMKARKMGCKSLKGKDTQRGLKYIFFLNKNNVTFIGMYCNKDQENLGEKNTYYISATLNNHC